MTPQTAWTEGLALLPQHFQNSDQFHREALFLDPGAPPSRGYGFTRLAWDDSTLETSQQLRVTSFSGIFPGGISFDSRHLSGVSLQRAIPEGLGVEHESIRAFLAIPAPGTEGSVVGQGKTFQVGSLRKHDETGDGPARDLAVLLPNISIRYSTEPMASMLALPICDLVRDRQGRPAVSDSSLPLLLDLHASRAADALLDGLVRTIKGRLGDLERQVPPVDSTGIRSWLETVHLRVQLAGLEHLASLPDAHPERLHQALGSLWAGLGFLRAASGGVPGYEHSTMPTELPALVRQVLQVLQTQHRENNLVRAMNRESQVLHSLQIPSEFLASGRRFLLAIQSGLPAEQLVPLISQHAKIASRSRLQAIITSALPGLEVRMTTPPDFFRPSGQVFFELVPSGPLWAQLLSEGMLCVYGHQALSVNSIELLVEGA